MKLPPELLRPALCTAGPGGQLAHQHVCCDWFEVATGRSCLFRTSVEDGVQATVDSKWHRLVRADLRVIRNPYWEDLSLPWESDDSLIITVQGQLKGQAPKTIRLSIGAFNDFPRSWIRKLLGIDTLKYPKLIPTAVMALSMLRQQGVPT